MVVAVDTFLSPVSPGLLPPSRKCWGSPVGHRPGLLDASGNPLPTFSESSCPEPRLVWPKVPLPPARDS